MHKVKSKTALKIFLSKSRNFVINILQISADLTMVMGLVKKRRNNRHCTKNEAFH